MGQDDGFPTPPHTTPNGVFGNLLGVLSYWSFPVTGRSHGLAAAAAPGHGQVALGAKKVALRLDPQVRVWAPQVRATFFAISIIT